MRWGRWGWALKPELGERRPAWRLSVHLPVNPFDRLSSPPPRLHFLLESDRGSPLPPPAPGVPSHKAFTISHVACRLRRCRRLAFTPTFQARTWGLPLAV